MILRAKHMHLLMVACLMALGLSSNAQTVPIKDPAFAQYIYDTYPAVSPSLGVLDTVKAGGITGVLAFQNRNIASVDEIVYFNNVKGILASGNIIKQVPLLNNMPNLKFVFFESNKITVPPVVNNMPTLEGFSVKNNKLSSIPVFTNTPNLNFLEVSINQLDNLDGMITLSQATKLDSVNLRYNDLVLSEILPLSYIPGYDTIFHYYKQNESSPDLFIDKYVGESISIEFPDIELSPTFRYLCIKNNAFSNVMAEGSANIYTMDNLKTWNSGIYEIIQYFDIANWEDKYVASGETTLKVHNCPVIDSISYSLDTLSDGVYFTLDYIRTAGFVRDEFIIRLENLDTKSLKVINLNEPFLIDPGQYLIHYDNDVTCASFFDSTIAVETMPLVQGIVFDTVQTCTTTSFILSDIVTDKPLLNPKYVLVDEDGNETAVEQNTALLIANGVYDMVVKEKNFPVYILEDGVVIEQTLNCDCVFKHEIGSTQLSYTLDTTENGIFLDFHYFESFGENLFTTFLLDEEGSRIASLTDYEIKLDVGEYTVRYDYKKQCTYAFEETISILPLPTLNDLPFEKVETCEGTAVTFGSISSYRPFLNPALALQNQETNEKVLINENSEIVLQEGIYDLIVTDNGLLADTKLDYISINPIDKCKCLNRSLVYSLDTTEQGIYFNIDENQTFGSGDVFTVSLVSSTGNTIELGTEPYPMDEGTYTVHYAIENSCSAQFDDEIVISALPQITSFAVDTVMDCNGTQFALTQLDTDKALLSPTLMLINKANDFSSEIETGELYNLPSQQYDFYLFDNGLLVDSIIDIVSIETKPICECLSPALEYNLDTTASGILLDIPVQKQFPNKQVSVTVLNADGSVFVNSMDNPVLVGEGQYTVLYTIDSECDIKLEETISILPLPEFISFPVDTTILCEGTNVTFGKLTTTRELLSPEIVLINTEEGKEVIVAESTEMVIPVGTYDLLVSDNGLPIHNISNYIAINPIDPCLCHKEQLVYDLDTTTQGIFLSIDVYKSFSEIPTSVQMRNNETGDVVDALSEKPKLNAGVYDITFEYENGCSGVFDEKITILPLPAFISFEYEKEESCDMVTVAFGDAVTTRELNNARYILVEKSGNNIQVLPNHIIELEEGEYSLYVYDNSLLIHSVDAFIIIPPINNCRCLKELDIVPQIEVACQKAQVLIPSDGTFDESMYKVIVKELSTLKTYEIAFDVETELPFGKYSITLERNDGCFYTISSSLILNPPHDCDLILYPEVEGAMDSYYVEGNGNAKLIDEQGNILVNKELPFTVEAIDDSGKKIPSGYYILLFENGNTIAVTIVR